MCNLVFVGYSWFSRTASGGLDRGWGPLSGGRVDAGPRWAPSPRGGRPGPATGVAWGTSGSCLRPFRLLGQQGAASSYVETPTWKNRRALDQGSRGHVGEVLDMHPPGSGAENITPGPPGKKHSQLEASLKSPRRQLRCTPCDVSSLYGSHVHHHCEDPASRGLCDAYIACASKTRQPRIRDPRRLKPSSSRHARNTQPWARAAKESRSSSARRTRTS